MDQFAKLAYMRNTLKVKCVSNITRLEDICNNHGIKDPQYIFRLIKDIRADAHEMYKLYMHINNIPPATPPPFKGTL